MTPNEAIMYMAMGFMIIIGIWLTVLTYLVLKRHKDNAQKEEQDSEKIEVETAEEEVSETEPVPEEEKSEEKESSGDEETD
jgi:hypothetical protein